MAGTASTTRRGRVSSLRCQSPPPTPAPAVAGGGWQGWGGETDTSACPGFSAPEGSALELLHEARCTPTRPAPPRHRLLWDTVSPAWGHPLTHAGSVIHTESLPAGGPCCRLTRREQLTETQRWAQACSTGQWQSGHEDLGLSILSHWGPSPSLLNLHVGPGGPAPTTPLCTWAPSSPGGRSRLRSGGHKALRGTCSVTRRRGRTGRGGRAGGNVGAAGPRGRSRSRSWGRRSCRSRSGRARHTEVPTRLGHRLQDEEGRRGSPGVSPSLASMSPSPLPKPVPCAPLRKRQLAALGLLECWGACPGGLNPCER